MAADAAPGVVGGARPGSDFEDLVRQGQDRLRQIMPTSGPRSAIVLVILALAAIVAWTTYYTVPSDSVAVVQRVIAEGPSRANSRLMHRSGKFLSNHPVCACEQGHWNIQTERLGSLGIDNEFKLGRLLNWQIGRFGPLEYFINICRHPAELKQVAWSV